VAPAPREIWKASRMPTVRVRLFSDRQDEGLAREESGPFRRFAEGCDQRECASKRKRSFSPSPAAKVATGAGSRTYTAL
jgi:hypothetical protein